ncbi:MAG: hypothetical protein ACTH8J_01440 [Specibacter sp.]
MAASLAAATPPAGLSDVGPWLALAGGGAAVVGAGVGTEGDGTGVGGEVVGDPAPLVAGAGAELLPADDAGPAGLSLKNSTTRVTTRATPTMDAPMIHQRLFPSATTIGLSV